MTNSNMQNSMVGVYCICFRLRIATLFGKFGPKNCSCQFKLKIGTWRIIDNRIKNKYEEFNSNVHYFVFSTRSMLFFWKFVPKIKIAC